MIQLISKFIRWFFRRWCKTARGKWHLMEYNPTNGTFVPMCQPWSVWNVKDTSPHTVPEGEVICKVCAKLLKDGKY